MRVGRGFAGTARRVVLVGMMGSGKSTVGRLLAERTGWPYHDNDELLDRLFKTTPRQILAEHGDAELRRMESAALRLGLEAPLPAIVAAPAGTILDAANRRAISVPAALVVWLRGSTATLSRRAVGAGHRAWLDDGAEAWISAAVAERDPLYAEVADLTIDVDDLQPAEICDLILAHLA